MKKNMLKRHHSKNKHFLGIVVFFLIAILIIYLFSIVKPPPTSKNKSTYTANAAGPIVWQQFDGDENKTGISNDPYITKSNVTSLKKIWQVPVSSDGSPVYLSGVTTAQGVKNLVFITTKNGGLTAFDESTGAIVWSITTSGSAGTITSSPAIDPNNLFIYNYGKDGKVHKYNVGTGTEVTTGGWPLTASLIPNVEKGSSALAIGNGTLYVTTSAYPGDAGQYVGHIVAKNLTSGAVSVYNMACSNTRSLLNGSCATRQSGVWARPGAVVDPNTGNVFVSSGNGPYAPPNNMGDSLVELSPDLSTVVDSYTPTSFQQLDNADADLGSADVAIIPSLEIGIQGGKDNKIRVLNLKNLSGQGGPYHTGGELQTLPVNCNIFAHPISWVDGSNTVWVFVNDMCNNLYAYKVANNRLTQAYVKNGSGGSSPLMVNGLLFDQTSGSIRAIDPTTGTILWTGQVGSMHWQSPAVVNGHVFVIDNSNLTAFAVPNNSPTLGASPTIISPTFGIVGDCQTNGLCPTPTLTLTPSGTTNPSTSPTGNVANPTPNPTTLNPCIASTASSSTVSAKEHHHNNGAISKFFQFLFQLLYLLFQLLLGGGTGPIQLPSPCPSPTPNIGGTVGITPSPTPNSVMPTVFETTPTPVSVTPTVGAGGGNTGGGNGSSSTPPVTRLGIWITAEDSGNFSTIAGQKPDVANYYLGWGNSWPSGFVTSAESAGATPFIELEPWLNGQNGPNTPQFSDIVAGKYDSWLTSIGNSVKTLNKPVIFTFAHEFNVSGQYPWAAGDTGSCGSSSCTPAQWIQAWDHVESVINTAAGGKNTFWMWAPNADTGGTTMDPTPWWPGANEVQMVGVDGYPDTQYGSQFGTFAGEFGPVFGEIHKLTKLPIFISETDLAPLGTGNYESIPNFIKDLFAAGGDGVLEWEDGSPKMSAAQWSQLDAALALYPN